mmetsp:Transcript_10649/g.33733  ORF Transcript_10649/g.33733 Transcript_10649/m.33733 type:complete len:420 (-) Transcript_10649:1003-2262(-)
MTSGALDPATAAASSSLKGSNRLPRVSVWCPDVALEPDGRFDSVALALPGRNELAVGTSMLPVLSSSSESARVVHRLASITGFCTRNRHPSSMYCCRTVAGGSYATRIGMNLPGWDSASFSTSRAISCSWFDSSAHRSTRRRMRASSESFSWARDARIVDTTVDALLSPRTCASFADSKKYRRYAHVDSTYARFRPNMKQFQVMVVDAMATGGERSSSFDLLVDSSRTNDTWKVDPTPISDSTDTEPPISSDSCLQMNRPRPVPPYSRVVDSSTCENSRNSFCCPSSLMPMPVSRTDTVHSYAGPSDDARTTLSRLTIISTSPSMVNFSALPSRLCRTWRTRVTSPRTHGDRSDGNERKSAMSLRAAAGATVCRVNSHASRMLNSADSSAMTPDSIFVTSITSFTMDSSRLDARVMPLT